MRERERDEEVKRAGESWAVPKRVWRHGDSWWRVIGPQHPKLTLPLKHLLRPLGISEKGQSRMKDERRKGWERILRDLGSQRVVEKKERNDVSRRGV